MLPSDSACCMVSATGVYSIDFSSFISPLQRIPSDCYVSFVHLCYTKRALHNIILLFCNMCRYYVIKVYSRLSATTLPENRIRYNISIFLSSRHILWVLYVFTTGSFCCTDTEYSHTGWLWSVLQYHIHEICTLEVLNSSWEKRRWSRGVVTYL